MTRRRTRMRAGTMTIMRIERWGLLACALLLSRPAAAASGPLLAVLEGHTDLVRQAVFTPDGTQVLSIGNDHAVRRWDAAAGRELSAFLSADPVLRVFAQGAPKFAAYTPDYAIIMRDLTSGKRLAALRRLNDETEAVALTPDGRTAATLSYEGEVILWDLKKERRLAAPEANGSAIAFSPDGGSLLVGKRDHTLQLYSLPGEPAAPAWRGHRGEILAVAFSPDGGKALSGARDNTLRLWDVKTGAALGVWRGHTSHVLALAFSPDGRRALSGGADYTVRLWDAAAGRELAVWWGHQGAVRDVAFSPDGKRAVSAGEDRRLMLWDARDGAVSSRPGAGEQAALPPGPGTPEERLGRLLFFDKRLSGDEDADCALCHNPATAYTDGLPLAESYTALYFRNTPTLLNLAAQKHLYWDGRFPADDLPSLIRDHISEAHFMNADGRLIVEKLRQAPGYVHAFKEVYGGEPSYSRILAALSAFVRSLKSGAPADVLTPAARRGRDLFNGEAGCAGCHAGSGFTDGKLHARKAPPNKEILREPLRRIALRRFCKVLGIENYAEVREDPGLYAVTKRREDSGKFKTPGLREVARTAPYMHNGSIRKLADAVKHENPRLSRRERKDIVAFLETLSSETPRFDPPLVPRYAVQPRDLPPAAGADSTWDDAPAPAPIRARDYPPLGPLPPVPVPEDNPLTDEKVRLGKQLFFDVRLSGSLSRSCAFCHEPALGWGDGSDLSQGYRRMLHWRNSQTLLNAAYYSKLEWDGAWPSLEEQARGAITSNINGNGDPATIEERLAESPEYVRMFKRAFGVQRPNFESVLKALASFQRAIPISRNVPFDQGALSPAARRGRELFAGKAGCIACHNGPLASDQGYHATGVPRNPAFDHIALRRIALRFQHVTRGVPEEVFRRAETDPGLYLNTLRKEDSGKFRTPSLRELKYTAPYMHNGVFPTLQKVIDFYDQGGGTADNKSPLLRSLGLTAAEKLDLIAFLEALSGEEIMVTAPDALGPHITATGRAADTPHH
ncbi:MAG: cytochrome c peroxidase [Elusimicrobiota bacterium]